MTRSFVWGITLTVLLGAAVLAGKASRTPRSTAAASIASVDPELTRCRTAGQSDRACQARWAAARNRFFGQPAS